MNYGISNWIVLAASILIALLGLLLAAKGLDTGIELAGWLFFIFGVGFSFRLAGKMSVAADDS
jgi:hypothetical protein